MTATAPLDIDAQASAIEAIHRGTAIYTAMPEIEALLDRLDWPSKGDRLLDPGCGNGGFLVAAIARLTLPLDDIETLSRKIRGYEFHPGAVADARSLVASHLIERGWSTAAATAAGRTIVEERDYLLSTLPVGTFDIIVANPPYWRYANIPAAYRPGYEARVPAHARADLLYAYLQRSADIVAAGGRIGLITADRWLLNDGSAELRAQIGQRFTILDVQRLESASAFYRPKSRRKGSPARVHPVSLILTPCGNGRRLSREPFRIEPVPEVTGRPLSDLADIRLAPWLGPEGIFYLKDASHLPAETLVPCVEPDDIHPLEDRLTGHSRWVIRTGQETPGAAVLAHLDRTLHAMPARGRRATRWLPPEGFGHKLPLDRDAIMIPRIAKRLRPILLPAGTMPINHNLVAVSGVEAMRLSGWLNHPLVQAQADAMTLRVESGYRSYTASLLRRLIIPDELLGPDDA